MQFSQRKAAMGDKQAIGKKSARGTCEISRTASLPARSIHSCARWAFKKSAKSDGDTLEAKRTSP